MRSALMLVTGLVLSSGSLAAQFAGFSGAVSQSDLLYFAGQPRLALEVLEEHLASDSTDYGALWRAARAAVLTGLAAEDDLERDRWLDPALLYAQRAVASRPDGSDGLYWRGVAAGCRAMNADARYGVALGQIVYDDAHSILAVDSMHAGAHNMLGKLNYEIMSLSRLKRAAARLFMGNAALKDSSWENAEYHLGRAAELWPDYVLFQFDLAQLRRKRGANEDAVLSFQRAIDLPAVHPIDAKLQVSAKTQLGALRE